MTDKEKAISELIEKSTATLNEVDVLMQNKFVNNAVNRLYYGCYYVTTALLQTKDLSPKTHKGTSKALFENFVHVGLFDQTKAVYFNQLLQQRMKDDYSRHLIYDKDEVIGLIQPAREFVAYIQELLKD